MTTRVIAIANQKGGVGKTTTAVNLSAALAELDQRVLVLDLDPQGNATTGLGIDPRSLETTMYQVLVDDAKLEDAIEGTALRGLFVAPASLHLAGAEIELVPMMSRENRLKTALAPMLADFDFVLIDCPPSLGLLTVNALAAAKEVLIPIQCEYYALEGLSQLLRNVELVRKSLNEQLVVSTVVLVMYDARTKLAEQVAGEVRAFFGDTVCRTVVPRSVRLSEAPSFGQPITMFDPTSRGAVAYRELAKEVLRPAATAPPPPTPPPQVVPEPLAAPVLAPTVPDPPATEGVAPAGDVDGGAATSPPGDVGAGERTGPAGDVGAGTGGASRVAEADGPTAPGPPSVEHDPEPDEAPRPVPDREQPSWRVSPVARPWGSGR